MQNNQISRKSYQQIKEITRLLAKEINFNKHYLSGSATNKDFDNFHCPRIDGNRLARAISKNLDISITANLSVETNPGGTYVFHTGGTANDDALSVAEVYCIMHKLSLMSRHEIEVKGEKVAALGRQVAQLLSEMNI